MVLVSLMGLQVGVACLGVQGLRLASTGTWPVLTAACLAEQVYMTIVTYSISSGTVRKQVGKPEGLWNRPCSVSPGLCLPAEGAPHILSIVHLAATGPSKSSALLWPKTKKQNRFPKPGRTEFSHFQPLAHSGILWVLMDLILPKSLSLPPGFQNIVQNCPVHLRGLIF